MADKKQLARWREFFGEMTPEEIKLLEQYERENGEWTRFASTKDGKPATSNPNNSLKDITLKQLENLWSTFAAGGWAGVIGPDPVEANTKPEGDPKGYFSHKPIPGEEDVGKGSVLDNVMNTVGQDNLLRALAAGKKLGADKLPGLDNVYGAFGDYLQPYMEDDSLPELPLSDLPPDMGQPKFYGEGSPNVTTIPKTPAESDDRDYPASMGIRG